MKKSKLILGLTFILFCCRSENKTYQKSNFLEHIDKQIGFQENWKSNYTLYGWSCYFNKESVIFSGSVHLIPDISNINEWETKESRLIIIDSINKNLNKNLLKKYSLWAQIANKDQFLPINESIDNPCEYYKEDNPEYYIYNSKIGDSNWEFIETTRDWERIEEIVIEKTKKIEAYIKEKEEKERPFYIKKWKGTYSFDFGGVQMGEEFEGSVSFKIDDKSSKVSFTNSEELLNIVKATKDTLQLQNSDGDIYKIYKDEQGNFNVSGHPIYMLNPPNESYLLTKGK